MPEEISKSLRIPEMKQYALRQLIEGENPEIINQALQSKGVSPDVASTVVTLMQVEAAKTIRITGIKILLGGMGATILGLILSQVVFSGRYIRLRGVILLLLLTVGGAVFALVGLFQIITGKNVLKMVSRDV